MNIPAKRKVFFRADGNNSIGLGHVIRSCALASMLRADFDCYFVIQAPLPSLVREIESVGAVVIPLVVTKDYLSEIPLWISHVTGNDIVVLDGYSFITDYQTIVKKNGCGLVVIDDIHSFHTVADIVINHAGGIREEDYSAEDYTGFRLGPAYALLRQPFLEAARIKKRGAHKKAGTLLISMGGADPRNDLLKMLDITMGLENLSKTYVVIGAAYQHETSLTSYIKESERNIEIVKGLNAEQMVQLMQKCEVAICPPSTTAFEYLSVGGILFLHLIADNQIDIHKYFVDSNLAFDIERIGRVSEDEINQAFSMQSVVFDGHSDDRLRLIFKLL